MDFKVLADWAKGFHTSHTPIKGRDYNFKYNGASWSIKGACFERIDSGYQFMGFVAMCCESPKMVFIFRLSDQKKYVPVCEFEGSRKLFSLFPGGAKKMTYFYKPVPQGAMRNPGQIYCPVLRVK